MTTPTKKNSGELKRSIFDAIELANKHIIEVAKVFVFSESDDAYYATRHALENAVYVRMYLTDVQKKFDKLCPKVELETAVEEANVPTAKRSARPRKIAAREMPEALAVGRDRGTKSGSIN